MPFAKRSTYTLTLAVSAALASSYVSAESTKKDAEMAWNCLMTQSGEWNCEVNEKFVKDAEGATVSSETQPPEPVAKPNVQENTVEEKAVVEPVSNVAATPIEKVNSTLEAEASEANKVAPANPVEVSAVTDTPSKPSATSAFTTEVVGDEWQCGSNASGDWVCRKVNVYAAALPSTGNLSSPSNQQAAPVYIADNPYSRLDWVYYQQTQGQQCSGRYLEPEFPIMGDEHLATPPLHLQAAQSSTVLGGLTQLQGGVNIRQGSRRLSSISAELDQVTNKARLEGDVKFREPGMLMLSDSAQIDTVTNEAIFSNAEYVLHEEKLRGTADRLIHLEDERIRMEQGKYTYCPPYSEAWGLEADSIVLNRAEGWGEAEDAVLRIGGVPVLYTPYFTFPIDDTRRSGFLAPSLSYSDDSGVDVSVPYYFNIAANMDDTLTPRYISDRGLLLENEFRYLNRYSENQISAAYLPDDDTRGDDRWLLGVNHKGKFAEKWNTNIDFTSISDDEYFEDLSPDLEVQREDHLDQKANATYSGNGWTLGVEVHDYQTIDGTAPYQLMPRITLKGSQEFADELNFNYLAELTRFDRDIDGLTGANRITGDRTHINPSIDYLWKRPWGFVKPELSLWSSHYSLDNQLSGFNSSPNISAPILSVDSGLFFDRNLESGGLHTLEPRLFALYVPDEDHSAVPDFDTSEYTFNYSYLFRNNRFSGKDRLGDTQQVSLGLTSRYINSSGLEKANISVAQAYYFADREVQLSNSTPADTSNQSDIATLANWYLSPNFKTYLDTVLDNSDFEVQSSTWGVKYNSDINHVVDFRYRFTDLTREQADLSFIWPLSSHWTSMGRVLYDIKENETEEASLGLEYESCCWKVSFAGRQWLDGTEPDGSNKYDVGLFIQLTLKGLGSFGSGSRGFLDDITGYEEREEHEE